MRELKHLLQRVKDNEHVVGLVTRVKCQQSDHAASDRCEHGRECGSTRIGKAQIRKTI